MQSLKCQPNTKGKIAQVKAKAAATIAQITAEYQHKIAQVKANIAAIAGLEIA